MRFLKKENGKTCVTTLTMCSGLFVRVLGFTGLYLTVMDCTRLHRAVRDNGDDGYDGYDEDYGDDGGDRGAKRGQEGDTEEEKIKEISPL